MEFVSIAFGILFFLAIHFSIEAKDEKKLRERNKQKAEREREMNEHRIEQKNREIKMKDLISLLRNSENSLSLIKSLDREESKDNLRYEDYRYGSMLKFENDSFSKTIFISEYPHRDQLKIQIHLSKRIGYGLKQLDLTVEDCYDVDNSTIINRYNKVEKECKEALGL